MEPFITLQQIDEIAGVIRSRTRQQPRIALILGSGLGGMAEAIQNPDIIPFADLPHWPVSTTWTRSSA